jgi:eukaryotic-like serine/threonine-protein kinase
MLPGQVIDDRFLIEALAGAGGMGAVYRARDALTGMPVALKLLVGQLRADAKVRFEREALALSELEHPGVVRYVARGHTGDGRPYLAMEWIDGDSLEARLWRGPLSLSESISLGIQLAEALGAAHARGIVHRDVKPANILLEGGAVDRPRLVDFGIAMLPGAARATDSGTVVGTPSYMAPEQAQGAPSVGPAADLFSLGCVLYECITGKPAFVGAHVMAVLARIVFEPLPFLRDLGHAVPAAFDALLARLTAKRASDRLADAKALAAALRAMSSVPDDVTPTPLSNRSTLTATEQRLLSIVLARSPSIGVSSGDPDGTTIEAPEGGPLRRVLAAIEANGGDAAVLSDGTIAVKVRAGGLATDQAALAARCALVVRETLPDSAVAVATGRVEAAAARAMGEAIDRAATMLRRRRHTSGPPAIDLDDVTAGLLDLRFEVTGGTLGLELVTEGEVADTARTLLGRPTAFVGRARETSSLEALFAECVDEPAARAAVVTAAAGVGKSRLRHEITTRIAARGGAEIWIARGDPMRAGVSFGMLAQIVRRIARLVIGEPAQVGQQKLLARVSRHVAASRRLHVAEMLGELVGIAFPEEGRIQLHAARQDPRLLGDQIRGAFLDLVEAETAAQPLVIVLEDLHWGDTPSAGVLDTALRMFRDRPLLALAFARPEVHERLPALWQEHTSVSIRLAELSRRECERLAQDVLGERATAELVIRLWERSRGNAFFLEELLRAAADGHGGDLPETMRAMIESRIATLDVEERRLLRAGSVFGESFWRGGLAALLGADMHRGERLARLAREEWIVRRRETRLRHEEEYTFQHALVQESAYSMLTEADRILGHKLAGDWLEAAGETEAAVLAEHFERGGDAPSAVRWYCAAAEQSLEGNNLVEAIERVKRACALGATGASLGRLALARALAHNWRGEHAEAAPWAATAMQMLPPGEARWAAAVGERIWTAGNSGDGDEVLALAKAILDVGRDARSVGAHATALAHAVSWLMLVGRHEDALRIQAAVDSIRSAGWDEPAVESAALTARMFTASGDPVILRELVLQSVAHYERVGDLRGVSRETANLADGCARLGAFVEAEAAARKSLDLARRLGLSFVAPLAQLNLGVTLLQVGMLSGAKEALAQAVAMSSHQENRRQEGIVRIYLALTLRRAGQIVEAETEAHRAVSVLAAFQPMLPLAIAALADALLAQERHAEALQASTRAFFLLETAGPVEEGEALIRLIHAEVLLASGHHSAARAALAAARAHVLSNAERIHDDHWRRSYLENIPENARILELARAHLPAPEGNAALL